MRKLAYLALSMMFLASAIAAPGDTVTLPNVFSAGTPARAADVNANFSALASAVNGNAQNIAKLQAAAPLLVKDSVGTVVGPYLLSSEPYQGGGLPPQEFVFIRRPGLSFAVRFSASALGAMPGSGVADSVYFLSTDCSGQGYIQPSSAVMPVLPYAAVLNTTAYVTGTAVTVLQPRSWLYYYNATPPATCAAYNAPGPMGMVPVVATLDLSTLGFVPPFSVQ